MDIHDRVIAALPADPAEAVRALVRRLHPDALLEPAEEAQHLAELAHVPLDVEVLIRGLIRLMPELPVRPTGAQLLAAVISRLERGSAP